MKYEKHLFQCRLYGIPALSENEFNYLTHRCMENHAYGIACDLYCGAFDSEKEAFKWYINKYDIQE